MASSSYDTVPYDSHPFPYTHPDHLATLATLFGMTPADVETCRVLELGCASGGNLIPMAQVLPRARCHGIDLSGQQIEAGIAIIEHIGLDNITLQHGDIQDSAAAPGTFDYIICHGVYSWVPDAVQAAILRICREHLTDQGVAYISYNTYPGWHLRASVREMMNFHCRGFDEPEERIAQSRALLDFLVNAVPHDGNAYSQLLRDELQVLQTRRDSYLFHEHLEDCNTPLYFHEFIERAQAAGLRFLSEASVDTMLSLSFSREVQTTLTRIAPDIIRMEQYLDFLRNRTFRRTLLCHKDVKLKRDLHPETLSQFHVSSRLKPTTAQPDPLAEEELVFVHPNETRVSLRVPIEKAALLHLWLNAPAAIAVPEVVQAASRMVNAHAADAAYDAVGCMLLNCYAGGAVDLHLQPDRYTLMPGATPQVTPLARLQAGTQQAATNLKHEYIGLGPFDAHLLPLLDGTRDRDQLRKALTQAVMRGELEMFVNDQKLDSESAIADATRHALEVSLTGLANEKFFPNR